MEMDFNVFTSVYQEKWLKTDYSFNILSRRNRFIFSSRCGSKSNFLLEERYVVKSVLTNIQQNLSHGKCPLSSIRHHSCLPSVTRLSEKEYDAISWFPSQ